MNTKYLPDRINYDGSQLRSHWIFETAGLLGDAIVAFRGKCDVLREYMVDLVDKQAGSRIYSEDMLHFIVEHFDTDLERCILRQRLLIAIILEVLCKFPLPLGERVKGEGGVDRRGNDLFDGDAKLSVSIATASPVSCLLHVGINVSSKNTPIKTKGLQDYNINPKALAEDVMKMYKIELEGVEEARWKVRGVQ